MSVYLSSLSTIGSVSSSPNGWRVVVDVCQLSVTVRLVYLRMWLFLVVDFYEVFPMHFLYCSPLLLSVRIVHVTWHSFRPVCVCGLSLKHQRGGCCCFARSLLQRRGIEEGGVIFHAAHACLYNDKRSRLARPQAASPSCPDDEGIVVVFWHANYFHHLLKTREGGRALDVTFLLRSCRNKKRFRQMPPQPSSIRKTDSDLCTVVADEERRGEAILIIRYWRRPYVAIAHTQRCQLGQSPPRGGTSGTKEYIRTTLLLMLLMVFSPLLCSCCGSETMIKRSTFAAAAVV